MAEVPRSVRLLDAHIIDLSRRGHSMSSSVIGGGILRPQIMEGRSSIACTTSAAAVTITSTLVARSGVPRFDERGFLLLNGAPDWLTPVLWLPMQAGALGSPLVTAGLLAMRALLLRWLGTSPRVANESAMNRIMPKAKSAVPMSLVIFIFPALSFVWQDGDLGGKNLGFARRPDPTGQGTRASYPPAG